MARWVAPVLIALAVFHTARSSSDGYGTPEDQEDDAKIMEQLKADPENQFGEQPVLCTSDSTTANSSALASGHGEEQMH